MSLTNEQILVRDTRNKNMLVSAAAGSGKTFVLVERIISQILDEKNGIDVDRILVVTFTTAAAAEMKDRIRKAIDKAVMQNASDARLRSQATLIHNAHIRTIDSFCSWVVKNYFYEINMDPSFRIGASGELKMLNDNIFTELLSKKLEEKDEGFKLLADAYINGRNTDGLRDMVFALHDKAASFAWPMEWYDNALKIYDISTIEELENSELVEEILKLTDSELSGIVTKLERFLSLYTEDCSAKDKDIFTYELGQIKGIYSKNTFNEKFDAISGIDFSTRWGTKGTCLNEDDVKRAKDFRGAYKKIVTGIKDNYYGVSLEDMLEDIKYIRTQAIALINFAKDYSAALFAEKQKRNIYDFNDIEHMALRILRNEESVEHEKRPVAIELSNHFKEIMVDEYQDSNELQEQILTAISSGNNYFTVGDVKQSIYAFRQASPALFIKKLYSYPMDAKPEASSIRIDLDKNFRSRYEVLNFCNQVFAPLMQMDVGGVAYNEQAALKLGDETFKGEQSQYEAEVLIATQNTDSMKELDIDDGDTLEALVIAKRIKELIASDFQVSCKGEDGRSLRPIKLNDIVILMRGVKGHSDKYIAALKDCGIPSYVAEETGFFDREEIDTVLSMLNVIDNPFNDIPLAAVLHSAMFGFSSERLAQIRATSPKVSLYECILEKYKADNDEDIVAFLDVLNKFRDEAIDTPIHEIIEHILEETDYLIYTKSLPNGRMAAANLNKLIDEAVSFESTSFKGLSRFVSYIEGLKTYDEDLGLAKTVSENDEAVRIMTIHKSKGLEFPVVFLTGCGKSFKNEAGSFVYDDKLGLALNYRNPKTRISYKTPSFNVVKYRMAADARGEYLRILYVALTRAVDKLIITAAIKPNKDKSVIEKLSEYDGETGLLDTNTKLKASSSIELIIRSLNASGYHYNKRIIDCEDLFIDEVERSVKKEQVRAVLEKLIDAAGDGAGNPIVNTLSFKYDGLNESRYKSKYSVSEIKHQAMEDVFQFNADSAPAFIVKEEESYIPLFMRQQDLKENTEEGKIPVGALYGTAMHRFLECYDFANPNLVDSFDEQLSYMKQIKCLSEDEFGRINLNKLKKFLKDDYAKRMSMAAANGNLYKEKPFVYGSDAKSLFNDDASSNEMILVQGIIDVFWEEEDGIVLLDYKTDKVDDEQQLVLRYERQLELYKNAIEASYGVKVKEVLIYSFALERSINLCTTK